ncbi:entericidin A/B family lipoprotein [Parvularcula sp. LCG005]|nr:entericidin A/B family lipoprotein [Parvularcula sp. LCG005]WOI52902.1 entericidin A/B family lipoprotein [Parvularcula sp. LCG005]
MMKYWKMLMLGLVAVSATACNTVEGFGRDVEEAGDEIEETANEVKN